jgi:hypothetical protein
MDDTTLPREGMEGMTLPREGMEGMTLPQEGMEGMALPREGVTLSKMLVRPLPLKGYGPEMCLPGVMHSSPNGEVCALPPMPSGPRCDMKGGSRANVARRSQSPLVERDPQKGVKWSGSLYRSCGQKHVSIMVSYLFAVF